MGIKKFFRRKEEGKAQEQTVQEPQPLAIEGIPPAPLTPEPDDAEIAAQALLEHLMKERASRPTHGPSLRGRGVDTDKRNRKHKGKHADNDTAAEVTTPSHSGEGRGGVSVDYYRHLARKMRAAREATRMRVTRFLAFVEQELKKPHLPVYGGGSLGLLEAELYKRLDIVEHEGGELLRRWQHCLALVTVRMMQATRRNENGNDNENDNDNSSTTEDTESSSTTN